MEYEKHELGAQVDKTLREIAKHNQNRQLCGRIPASRRKAPPVSAPRRRPAPFSPLFAKPFINKLVCVFFVLLFILSAFHFTARAYTLSKQHRTDYLSADNRTYAVYLQKYEKDITGAETTVPVAEAEFVLYRADGGGRVQQGTGVYKTNAQGRIMVEGLVPGEYVFVETNPTRDYDYDQKGGAPLREYFFTVGDGQDVTRVPVFNRRIAGSLIITKTVRNADESDLTEEQLEQEFEFTVTFSDGGTYDYSISNGTSIPLVSGETLTLKHGEKAIFGSIPAGVNYIVAETPAEYYMIDSDNHRGTITEDGAQADFVNTYNEEDIDGDAVLTVKKVVEGEVNEADIDKSFRFTVTFNDETYEFYLKAGETSEPLPLPYGAIYEIAEQTEDGWAQVSLSSGYGTGAGIDVETVQTNRFTGRITAAIGGEKTWDISANSNAQLPESITVYLKNGDQLVSTAIVAPDEDDKWLYSFTAPKYESDGVTVIDYTVEEAPVRGFATEVNGANIKNTALPPEKTTISGCKTWDHGWLDPKWQPESITIFVKADGIIVTQQTVTASDNWSWSFTLDKHGADGHEIVYTIDEIKERGYTKTVDGYNVKNTFNPDDPDMPDEWIPEDPSIDPAEPPVDPGSQTGDSSNMTLWIILMFISEIGLIATAMAGSRNSYRPKYLKRRF